MSSDKRMAKAIIREPPKGGCWKKCRRHKMFIDEKRSWISRSSELSEMSSISLNSEENKMGVRASYKHFAATRLFSRQTPKRATAVSSNESRSFRGYRALRAL